VRAALALAWLLSGAAWAAPSSLFVEELTSPEVEAAIAAGKTSAIYYAGSTEQNGPHLALGKHNVIARYVAGQIAAQLGNALVYPVLPFAPTGEHLKFAGTVHVSDETFASVAHDVATSALAAGFKSILLMGDHGGGQDALRRVAVALDAQAKPKGARVFYVGDAYYKAEERMRDYLVRRGLPSGAHAGLEDTAMLMFLAPQLVRRDELARASTASGVDGDPRRATPEIGKALLDIKVQAALAQIRGLLGGP
jgi:creatinine amidohydrolase